jgi:membrane-associated phospholipid phosphatase
MTDHLARWVSILFDGSVLSIPIFLALGWIETRTPGLVWAALTLIIVTGFPLAYLAMGRKRGWVSDLEMTQRSERPPFIMVSLGSDVIAFLALRTWHGPSLLTIMVLTYFCLAITMLTISRFWKISLHMAGAGGFGTALVFVFGLPAMWAYLSLPLVAWARLYRRKHSPAQLAAGAILGVLVTALVFSWMGMRI